MLRALARKTCIAKINATPMGLFIFAVRTKMHATKIPTFEKEKKIFFQRWAKPCYNYTSFSSLSLMEGFGTLPLT
jgi:hypothetical protein